MRQSYTTDRFIHTRYPLVDHHHHHHEHDLYNRYRQNLMHPRKEYTGFVRPNKPERVLDAPGMSDDYYRNILDWSCRDMVAIALDKLVCIYSPTSSTILSTYKFEERELASVQWMLDGTHLAIGTDTIDNSSIEIVDISTEQRVVSLGGGQCFDRIGALAWNSQHRHLLSSGGHDGFIHNHDIRVPRSVIGTFVGHRDKVCGLKWNTEGTQLASGGNDNLCKIWDVKTLTKTLFPIPLHRFDEATAGLKALAWCPFLRNILAVGAGSEDRHIRFYNTNTDTLLHAFQTTSQVTSLQWNPHKQELLSSHGYNQDQLNIWKYPSMTHVAELKNRQFPRIVRGDYSSHRILHTALSPDGTIVVSAGADELLLFWRVWGGKQQQQPTQTTLNNIQSILTPVCIR